MKAISLAALLVGSAVAVGALAVPATPAMAITVFDSANYAQNLVQAARALEQINHQVESLQNEASMLRNMARNLERVDFPELERVRSAMGPVTVPAAQATAFIPASVRQPMVACARVPSGESRPRQAIASSVV